MSTIAAARTAKLMSTLDKEVSIISRREIEPLLVKARKILKFYDEALDCSAAVLDNNGFCLRTPEYKNQARFCEFCKKHVCKSYLVPGGEINWDGYEFPCETIHFDAQAESQRIDETYVYTCPVGFVYWTSPLYRNGRYIGALTAGQVLSCDQEAAAERLHALSKDKIAAEKFCGMIEDVPVKNHEEIQAMAWLLGACAEEISGKKGNSAEIIRRLACQNVDSKGQKTPNRTREKEDGPSPEDTGPEYSLETERMLFAAFRRGDNEAGGRYLKELMDGILAVSSGNLEIIRIRAIELIVLLSRADVSDTSGSDTMQEANNRYLKRIQESGSSGELMENLRFIVERMAGKIFSFQGIRHASVLRRAERYIWENYTRKISLDEIARASGLSAPYFSTVFKEEMGENLSSYLNRLRVEKAVTMLTETGKQLNEIAGLCGFEDQSWFSKIFKIYTGMSPGKYRENGGSPEFRIRKNHAKQSISFPDPAAPELNKQEKLSS